MSYDGVLQPWYPAHKHPYLILQAIKRMPVAQVQWPSTVNSGQFKGKTWLPQVKDLYTWEYTSLSVLSIITSLVVIRTV